MALVRIAIAPRMLPRDEPSSSAPWSNEDVYRGEPYQRPGVICYASGFGAQASMPSLVTGQQAWLLSLADYDYDYG